MYKICSLKLLNQLPHFSCSPGCPIDITSIAQELPNELKVQFIHLVCMVQVATSNQMCHRRSHFKKRLENYWNISFVLLLIRH